MFLLPELIHQPSDYRRLHQLQLPKQKGSAVQKLSILQTGVILIEKEFSLHGIRFYNLMVIFFEMTHFDFAKLEHSKQENTYFFIHI